MKNITHLSTIADRYDAFILDLWGVIHDGSHLYPGVREALTQMRAAGKKIAMLSNAPRRARKVAAVLGQLGVEAGLYDYVLSSGEAGYEWLAGQLPLPEGGRAGEGACSLREARKAPSLTLPRCAGEGKWKSYYYIGPAKDADVLDGLDYVRADDLKQADFLLNVGFGSEEQSSEDITPLLKAARACELPMLCLNPDLEVVKQTGQRFPCAGVIGHAYVALGGQVQWFGKPYPQVYEECMAVLGAPKSRILAIGDSLETDIPGAVRFGIDCALVTGGILHHHSDEDIARLAREAGMAPTYVMPSLLF